MVLWEVLKLARWMVRGPEVSQVPEAPASPFVSVPTGVSAKEPAASRKGDDQAASSTQPKRDWVASSHVFSPITMGVCIIDMGGLERHQRQAS